MITWHIEKRKIKDLIPYNKNARSLTKQQATHLKKSLQKFGLIDKPIINLDNTIIGGHQRISILKKLKEKEIECYIPSEHLDEKDLEELNIRLNKNTGEWDYDILANEWNYNDLIEWGFTSNELIEIDQHIDVPIEEDTSELLEPGNDEDAITKLGDIYELNNHRLICGDSTIGEYVSKCLNGNEPILMITDPPYGVEYDPSWRGKVGKGYKAAGKVQNDDQIDWSLAWNLFPGSIAYIWCASLFLPQIAKSIDNCNFEIKRLIIWAKQHFALSRGDYHWQHENCWYAIKKGHQHNWQGSRKESTLWQISNLNCFGKSIENDEERTAHSTQKPIECMARPIRNNTSKDQSVYDPFLGSGTTLIAAEQLGRICYGIELSAAYCDIIVNRYCKYMQKNGKEYIIKKNNEIINWEVK